MDTLPPELQQHIEEFARPFPHPCAKMLHKHLVAAHAESQADWGARDYEGGEEDTVHLCLLMAEKWRRIYPPIY